MTFIFFGGFCQPPGRVHPDLGSSVRDVWGTPPGRSARKVVNFIEKNGQFRISPTKWGADRERLGFREKNLCL